MSDLDRYVEAQNRIANRLREESTGGLGFQDCEAIARVLSKRVRRGPARYR